MENKYTHLLKNTGILTVSNLSSGVLNFLLVPLYTGVLTTGEYGVFDLIFSTFQIAFPILTLNVGEGVLRFTLDGSADRRRASSIGFRILCVNWLVSGLFLLLCGCFHLFRPIEDLEPYIFLYYFFYAGNRFMAAYARGADALGTLGVAGILNSAALVGCNLLFLLVFKWGLRGYFTASMLSMAVSSVYMCVRLQFFSGACGGGFDRKLCRSMIAFSFPLVFTSIGWWFNNSADRYMVAYMIGTSANGLLSVAYKVPSILSVVLSIFDQAFLISAVKENKNDGAKEFYGEVVAYGYLASALLCSVLILLTKPLAGIMFAKDFYQAWVYVPFLLISAMFNAGAGMLGPVLVAATDSKSMARSAVAAAAVNVVLNAALIRWIGIQGAAVATVVSGFVIYAVRRYAARGRLVLRGRWRFAASWVLLCVQAALEIFSVPPVLEAAVPLAVLALNFRTIRGLCGKLWGLVSQRRTKPCE